MGVLSYLGMVGLSLLVAVGAKWFDPAIVEQLSRKTGLDGTKGWAVTVAALGWAFLPLLAGARVTDDGTGDLWLAGPALAMLGVYLGTMAVTARDEYGLLRRADEVSPAQVRAATGDDVVATSGVPSVVDEREARTPFTGAPAVHTDWMVQRRTRTGFRKTWRNVASGVESVRFTLGDGAVAVEPGRHRVFTNAERFPVVEPDDELPGEAAKFLHEHADLPSPDDREEKLRLMETFVPADEPVTVVGVPRQGDDPGRYVIAEAPPDTTLGTHTDRSTDDDSPEAVLVKGSLEEARTQLHRRVRWLGVASVVLLVGGQLLAFALSNATLPL